MGSSTLFPKITQYVSDVVKALKELEENDPDIPDGYYTSTPIPLIGHVKLHGTHADIVVYNDNRIILQSRNVCNITIANDNSGFAAAMADKADAVLELRNRYVERWKAINPSLALDPQYPVIIAGEWVGTGIQKDVAVSQLSRRFVIVSVAINNSWIEDTYYRDYEAPEASIYNVSRGGTFRPTLYPDDIPRTLKVAELFAERVALTCPFALEFGVHGEGEGIVWKPAPEHLNANPALWFKTKGGRFKPSFAPKPKVLPVGVQEQRDAADAAAIAWCTRERLQQGWDYLKEVGMKRDVTSLSAYLKWVQNDILVEEKGFIQEQAIDGGMLPVGIAKIARLWYIQRVGLGED
ncbi:hypothetical protein E8E12_011370 [Didymella heteroderae]|uniref:RNA ligase domain-containing protein n=1 Tax=Didymella heteroderae TaxID=1769908 RepID=A0A9P5C4V4_9PLEO|nr:hypothetical protein E8E12_011370 [Didymella heteroderae]